MSNRASRRAAAGRGAEDPLHVAARTGDLTAVQSILTSTPQAINSRDRHSRTPLHLAAWSGQTDVVRYLCTNKADVGATAMDNMSAIHFASQKGHLEIVRILVFSGASVKISNRKGFTPLHFAVKGSHLDLIKYLMKKGASLGVKNKSAETPFDLAENDEVRSMLKELEKSSVEEKKPPKVDEIVQEKSADKDGNNQHPPELDEAKERNGDEHPTAPEEENGQREKRNGKQAEIEGQNSPTPKRAKVALGHLLAENDLEEEG